MLTTRAATRGDISTLRALAREIWLACYSGIIPVEQIEYMLGWMYSEPRIQSELAAGVHWDVTETDDTPVGFLSYEREPDGRVKLHKLYLLPAQHGLGHGRELLAHVAKKARALGAREVWLQVNKQNKPAISAYLRAGYHIAGEGVFDIGRGFVMDDYLMAQTV